MIRFRLSRSILLAVCVAATGCGAGAGGCAFVSGGQEATPTAITGAAIADPTKRPARPRIVFLGDSLTIGLGLVESQSYPSLIEKQIEENGYQFDIVNAGISGDTSAGGLRRLDWALEGEVRVLVLALGANDGLRGLSVGEMKENLTTIITRAREKNIVVIFVGMEAPPNYGPEYTASFRAAFRDVAAKERVLFIPFLLTGVAGVASLNQPDGIHPNAQGTALVAETVWPVLRSVLDQMAAAQ